MHDVCQCFSSKQQVLIYCMPRSCIGQMEQYAIFHLKGKTCAIMMEMAKEARKRSVGALHPSFNLLKIVHDFLEHELPDEAHLLASGRLFVSLTRVSDGKNLLVSHFHSKEDLIQVIKSLSIKSMSSPCHKFPLCSLRLMTPYTPRFIWRYVACVI